MKNCFKEAERIIKQTRKHKSNKKKEKSKKTFNKYNRFIN